MRAAVMLAVAAVLAACGSSQQAEQKKIEQQQQAKANAVCQNVGAEGTPQYGACVSLYNQYNPPPSVK